MLELLLIKITKLLLFAFLLIDFLAFANPQDWVRKLPLPFMYHQLVGELLYLNLSSQRHVLSLCLP